ncbi:MAG: sugar transferase [Patescibacteria group bacterium]
MRKFLLFWGDVAFLYLALFLTLLVRYGYGPVYAANLDIHLMPFSLIFAVWALVFYTANLYEIGLAKNRLEFYSAYFYSFIINALIAIVFFYFVPFFKITPRTNFFIFLAWGLVLLTGWRFFFNGLIAKGSSRNNTLILGLSPQSQELYDYLLANPQLGYKALGIIDVEHENAPNALQEIIRQKKVSILILGPAAYKISRIIDILYGFLGLGIRYYDLSDFYERVSGKVPVGAIDQTWFLENLSEGGKRGYEIAKRIWDLVLAVAIGAVILPFYPLIMLAIRLDSPGPAFIRQKRIGKAGKIFILVKFRNMIANSPDGSAEGLTGPVWASEDDSRVTRVGKFLRRSRIDELPQIWNVLRGEMSFIGPRPERPEFHGKLKEQIPFYDERYLVKPGLTGWAQVKYRLDFRAGLTIQDTLEKLQYDLFYIKNRSLLLDLGIILKTASIILKKIFH